MFKICAVFCLICEPGKDISNSCLLSQYWSRVHWAKLPSIYYSRLHIRTFKMGWDSLAQALITPLGFSLSSVIRTVTVVSSWWETTLTKCLFIHADPETSRERIWFPSPPYDVFPNGNCNSLGFLCIAL